MLGIAKRQSVYHCCGPETASYRRFSINKKVLLDKQSSAHSNVLYEIEELWVHGRGDSSVTLKSAGCLNFNHKLYFRVTCHAMATIDAIPRLNFFPLRRSKNEIKHPCHVRRKVRDRPSIATE